MLIVHYSLLDECQDIVDKKMCQDIVDKRYFPSYLLPTRPLFGGFSVDDMRRYNERSSQVDRSYTATRHTLTQGILVGCNLLLGQAHF